MSLVLAVFLLDTPGSLAVVARMKQEERTIFNASNIRLGRVGLTISAYLEMQEKNLNLDQLEETFRYGEEVEPGKLVCSFGNYTVGMFYVKDETRVYRGDLNELRYLIIACWRKETRRGVNNNVRL